MYEGGLPIAARSAEMWFTTNTAFQRKKGARLEKEEYVKGEKRSRIHRCSHGVSSGRSPELLQVAVEAELEEFLEQWKLVRDRKGRKAVVKNGYNPERSVATGIGPLSIRMPKVRDRSQSEAVFHSALVPPYIRKSRSVEELMPLLYLKGGSTSEYNTERIHPFKWMYAGKSLTL